MEKDEIFVRLRNIIADVVKNPGLQLTDDMSAHDVDGWGLDFQHDYYKWNREYFWHTS